MTSGRDQRVKASFSRAAPLLIGMGWYPDQTGGLNRYVSELCTGLWHVGVDVVPLVMGPAGGARAIVPAKASDPLIHRLLRSLDATGHILPLPQVVDVHFALYAALPITIGPLRGVPMLLHFHGPWAEEGATSGASSLVTFARKRVEKIVYRRAAEVIVLSQSFKRLLVERYSVSPWRVRVVPGGVNLSTFTPGNRARSRVLLEIPQDSHVALAVRRLVPRMGLEDLLRAWKRLKTETGREDLLLLIAGDGPERARLELLTRELHLSRWLRFLGELSDELLIHCYRAADVSLVPSVALEGFGLVVLESLACGTPVVASDAGGLPEVLAKLGYKLIVPSGNVTALAERLEGWLAGSDPFPSSGECRTYAEGFSWTSTVRQTEQSYERVAAATRSRNPRVVYLDHCAQLSGGELALLRLIPSLKQIDSHVILAEDGPLVHRLMQTGISVEVLPLGLAARRLHKDRVRSNHFPVIPAFVTAGYVLRLARRLRRLRPDIVHANSLKAAVYGGLAGRLAGVPVVWHLRDRIAPDYLPEDAVRLIRWLAPHVAAAVVANSQTTLDTLYLPRASGCVIPSPVVFDAVEPHESPSHDNHSAFIVGMVGRIAPWKGQDVFIDAFAQAFPEGDAQAIIVGAALFGEDQFAEELRSRAAKHGLNGRMEFAGFRDDVAERLNGFDALVHASIIAEPFGQVVVEGMAAGLPVIASAAGGPAEIIKDGVDGLLYEPGNVEALAGLLRRLSSDAELRTRLGQAARLRARDFAPDVIAGQIVDVYRSILERGQ